MIIRPIYKKDTIESTRDIRTMATIVIINVVISVIFLMMMSFQIGRTKLTANIDYASFLSVFAIVAKIEGIFILVMSTALASGSIGIEKMRGFIELTLTTRIKVSDIVWGKYISTLAHVSMIIISAIPILSLIYIFGGINVNEMIVILLSYVGAGIYGSAIGMISSAQADKSSLATIIAFSILFALLAGTYAIDGMKLDGIQTGWTYIFNPLKTIFAKIDEVVSSNSSYIKTYGIRSTIGIIGQIFISFIIVSLSTFIMERSLRKKYN